MVYLVYSTCRFRSSSDSYHPLPRARQPRTKNVFLNIYGEPLKDETIKTIFDRYSSSLSPRAAAPKELARALPSAAAVQAARKGTAPYAAYAQSCP